MAFKPMNPQGHWGGAEPQGDGDGGETVRGSASENNPESDMHHPPHIHIRPVHKGGQHVATHVHVMHENGKHEEHKHEPNDAEGIASHVHEHFGGGEPAESMAGEESSGTNEY